MNKERNRNLIYLLVNKKGFVTAKELATEFHSSEKTIYRIVANINKNYGQYPLIVSERGRGYKLDYKRYLEDGRANRRVGSISNVSPVERRNQVMKHLLLIAPKSVQINELFEQYFLSHSSQVADEKIIAEILRKYNLRLIKNHGFIKVQGSELNIRDAIQSLINNYDIVDLNQILESDNFPRKFDVRFVFEQIKYIEATIQSTIPYPYNLNLFSHMYILIDRIRNTRQAIKKQNDEVMDGYLKELPKDQRLFEVSQEVIKNTEDYVSAQLPRIETYYLYQYLVSSRIDGFQVENISENSRVQSFTKQLINLVEKNSGQCFDNSILASRLAEHIRPMLNRLDNNIKINNNLLDQIRIEYAQMFHAVRVATTTLTEQHRITKIDDNEVGFLTLYFASELEKHKQSVATLIMCTTGIGTSELLKTKINANFTNLNVVDVVSTSALDQVLKKHPEVQLVISTVNPLHPVKIPVVVVSAMFNAEDKKKLNEELGKL